MKAKVHLETQNTTNNEVNTEQKKKKKKTRNAKVSQYLTSNYTTDP
jgi:hypothetical protein